MDQLDYMLNRDEYEKDVYERQQAYRKLEARWPKWIKRSSWIIWGVFLLLGFLFHHSAMGLMLGFVIGGGISLGYEALCRVIYAKKHGITDIRGKETIRALAREQTRRKTERDAALQAKAEAEASGEAGQTAVAPTAEAEAEGESAAIEAEVEAEMEAQYQTEMEIEEEVDSLRE